MTKHNSKTVKRALLKGDKVSHNRWAILIDNNDQVVMKAPNGDARVASFMYLDRAINDFCKAAGIPEKTPKPITYPTAPKGNTVLGPDSTTNNPWKDPEVETQPNKQTVKMTSPDLGGDTSMNSPWKDPAINYRPQPSIGTGGLPNTDLGKDTTGKEPPWGFNGDSRADSNWKVQSRRRASGDMSDVEGESGSDPDSEFYPEINEKNYQIKNKGENPTPVSEYHANKVKAFCWDSGFEIGLRKAKVVEDWDKVVSVLGERLAKRIVADGIQSGEEALEEANEGPENEEDLVEDIKDHIEKIEDIIEGFQGEGEEEEEEDEDDDEEEEEDEGIKDTFSEEKVGKTYEQLLSESPADNLLKDIGDTEKWTANRAVEALGQGYMNKKPCTTCDDTASEDVEACDRPKKNKAKARKRSSIDGKTYQVGITYEVVTEESAQEGDFADSGWEEEYSEYSVEDIKDKADSYGIGEPSSSSPSAGMWWSSVDSQTDMATGDETTYALHIKNSDGSSLSEEDAAEFNEMLSYNSRYSKKNKAKAFKAKLKGKKLAVQFKENWGSDGAYGRDIEAETPEEIYHMVRSFGNDDDYDWSKMAPRQPAEETLEESGMDQGYVAALKRASDPAAEAYWGEYYGDYGDQMTKDDSGNKNRKDKDRGNKGNGDKKKVYEPKVDDRPGKNSRIKRMRGQAVPAAPAGNAPPGAEPTTSTPADGAQAPAAPGAPAPVKPAKPEPGAGDEGLKALGWTDEDIKLMQPDQKEKILQVKLNKPGAQAPAPAPVAPKAPKAPAAPPAAPGQAPAPAAPAPAPAAPAPAPVAARRNREAADKQKIRTAFQRLVAQAMEQQAPAVPAAPAAPPAAPGQVPGVAPTTPAPAPGAAAPLAPGSAEEQVFGIYQEVLDMDVQASSPMEIQAKKVNELMKRAISEVGMTPQDVKKLFGKDNLMGLFPV